MDKRVSYSLYFIGTLSIIAGFILSVISYLKVCADSCGKAHDYTLCGYSFECYGMIFFPILGILHLAFFHKKVARFFTALLIAGAVGAEIDFLLVQKYQIQSFCPICLAIAACILIIAITYSTAYLIELKQIVLKNQKGEIMKSIRKGLSTLSFVFFGFLFAFVGVVKEDSLKAAENSLKEKIVLGNAKSNIEVYFFTDWQCPACRTIEPTVEALAPKIMAKARLIFVDTVVHKETLNYSPYNVAFLINNKPQYFALRKILTEMSISTKEPSETQVKNAILPLGAQYKHLSFADIAAITSYFDTLVKDNNIQATPTMVIIHDHKLPGKILQGSEITEANVMKAINTTPAK